MSEHSTPAAMELPPGENLGEAMRALVAASPFMARWAVAKVETGASDKECARLAGYSAASEHALEATGYRVKNDPRVQAAILELSQSLMRTEGPKSIKTLVMLRDDTKVKPEVRMKCAVELMNRAGMHAVSEGKLTVTHKLSDSEMDQRILALAAELQIPAEIAQKMLIAPADMAKNAEVIDAEFVEVVEPLSAEEQARRDRENDLRSRRRAMTPEQRQEHDERQRAEKSAAAKRKYAEAQRQQFDLEEWINREGIEDLMS